MQDDTLLYSFTVLSEIGSGPPSSNNYYRSDAVGCTELIPKSLIISLDELTFGNKVLGAGENAMCVLCAMGWPC